MGRTLNNDTHPPREVSAVRLDCPQMPGQIADVRIFRWKSETTQRLKARKVPNEQRLDLLGQEYDENQAFSFDV